MIPIALAALAMGVALMIAKTMVMVELDSGLASMVRLALLIAAGLFVNALALFTFGALRPAEVRAAWIRRDLREGNAHGTGTPTQRQDVSK